MLKKTAKSSPELPPDEAKAAELVARATTRPARPSDEVAASVIGEANTSAFAEERGLALWVDDCKHAPAGCAVARTFDDALHMLRRYDYQTLYLDHDLGEERTGYDLLVMLIEENRVPPRVECISWNPVGRARILAALRDFRSSSFHAEGVPEGGPAPSQEDITGDIARGKP